MKSDRHYLGDASLIKKKRTTPHILKQVRALKRRLSRDHPQYTLICHEEKKRSIGFKGEMAIDYYLAELADDYWIYHDLRLPIHQSHFQIDTLILTCSFIQIIEIKSLAGVVYIDPVFKQMIRTLNGKEEGFLDPIAQVKLQKTHLIQWLAIHHFPRLPVADFVTISSPETILKTQPGNSTIPRKICHMHQVIDRIHALASGSRKKILTPAERERLSAKLVDSYTPLQKNILQHYHIDKKDLITGVHCPSCHVIPMNRIQGAWHCPNCECKSTTAHQETLEDYFLLISDQITNREFRKWAQLDSRSTATRLLRASHLSVSGNKKNRTYHQKIEKY